MGTVEEEQLSKIDQTAHWLFSELQEADSQITSTTSIRTKWSEADTTSIRSGFVKFDHRPTKDEILEEFQNNDVLWNILKREGFQRLFQLWKFKAGSREEDSA